MKYLDLETRESFGNLDRAGWSKISDDYVQLKKSRNARFHKFGYAASVAFWVGTAVCIVGAMLGLALGAPALVLGVVIGCAFFFATRHFTVCAERDCLESKLAKKRAREINRWLNEQASNLSPNYSLKRTDQSLRD